MAEKLKKGLYHSELVQMGQVTADITSDVLPSKYKKGTFYCAMIIDGRDREYNVENDTCKAKLADSKGQRLLIEATGSREDADIEVLSADWTPEGEAKSNRPAPRATTQRNAAPARPTPPASQAVPPARPTPPAQNQQQQPVAEPPPAKQTAKAPANTSTVMLIKLANLMLKVQCTVQKIESELLGKRGIETTPDQRQGMVGMLYIQMTRDNYHHQMPDTLIDITPPPAKATEAPTS